MQITFAGLNTTGKVEMVWCVFELGMSRKYNYEHYVDYLIAWGRRGGKLRTQLILNRDQIVINSNIYNPEFVESKLWGPYQISKHGYSPTINPKIFDKILKGYVPFAPKKLSEIDPGLEEQLNKLAFWEQLKL